MSVEDTLKQWGIAVEQDEYFFEYLQKQYPDNIYHIDYCPFPAGDKYNQVETLFQEVLEHKADRDEYMRIERKFNDVMVKLWLYNEVYIYFNYIYTKRYNKGYRKLFRQYIKGCPASKNNPISDKKVLEMLTKLSFRKCIQIEMYLKEFQMVVVPSWSFFVVYFNDI